MATAQKADVLYPILPQCFVKDGPPSTTLAQSQYNGGMNVFAGLDTTLGCVCWRWLNTRPTSVTSVVHQLKNGLIASRISWRDGKL